MAEFPSHPLVAVRLLEVAVQLACGCGKITVLTFPGAISAVAGES